MKRSNRVCVTFFAAAALLACAFQYREQKLQEKVSEKILRFHVLANSNAEADQALKLKVRNEIGAYLGRALADAENLEECEREVQEHLAEIQERAESVVEREGYAYPVRTAVQDTDFPEKTYGSYTFPEGRYRALRVVIGDGAGENWWCVMYPNLCFAGSVYEAPDENSTERLRKVLTEEEYAEIVAEGKVKVKFKYLEKLLGMFGDE